MDSIVAFLSDPTNQAVILGFLFALSEVLSLIPSIKSNGVFQAIFNLIQKLRGKTPSA